MEALSIKDFIIDISETQEELKTKKKKSNTYSENQYDVVLENNTDFVLNRKTVTTDKNLVFLISQGLFYIKDNKRDKIEDITEQRLRSFFQQIYYDKFDKFIKVQWWNNSSPERKLDLMIAIIKNPTMQKMYQHNVFVTKSESKSWEDVFNKNTKLFSYCYTKLGKKVNFSETLKMSGIINDKLNYNNATLFIDKLSESDVKFGVMGLVQMDLIFL